jgi:hypothetical protein
MSLVVHGRFPGGFAWTAHPTEFMERTSAALAADGKVWLIDPVRADGLEPELQALGRVAGVVMTMTWHDRDVAWFSALYGVPVYVSRYLYSVNLSAEVKQVDDEVPESPLRLMNVSGRGLMGAWRETAVWWPQWRLLCVGDCLGRAKYYVRSEEQLAVHPLRRLSPPDQLRALVPDHIYCGHGPSLGSGAAKALEQALSTARRELPRGWWHSLGVTARYYGGKW